MGIKSSSALDWWGRSFLYLLLTSNLIANDKDQNAIVQGVVFLIDKDTSTVMVDTKSGARRVVVYSTETKFSYGRSGKGQVSAISDVQKTQYISCRGRFGEGERLVALECAHRWP